MDDLKCSFCFDVLDNCDVTYADKCLCKVKYHIQCIKDLNDNGWDCPICRKKNNNYNRYNNTINTPIINQNNINSFLNIFFELFISNPNVITFLFFFIFSIIISVTCILPYVTFIIIKGYVENKIIASANLIYILIHDYYLLFLIFA